MSIEKAVPLTLKMVVPAIILFFAPFFIINGWTPLNSVTLPRGILFVLTLPVGIIVHELLHAFVFAFFSRGGWRSVSFGIDRKTLSPYCHPLDNLRVLVYRAGALAPLVVMGFIPAAISFFNGNFAFLLFGFIFSVASGGDIISVWMTRGLSNSDIIKDHSSKLGFYIISRDTRQDK